MEEVRRGNLDAAHEALSQLKAITPEPFSCKPKDFEDWSAYQAGLGLETLTAYAKAGATQAQIVAVARSEILERQERTSDGFHARCGESPATQASALARSVVRQWVTDGQAASPTWDEDVARAEEDFKTVRWNARIRECAALKAEMEGPAESRATGIARDAQQQVYQVRDCIRFERERLLPNPDGFPEIS